MRVAVLVEDRCKPNSNAYAYMKKYSALCERECIQFDGDKCKILESACPYASIALGIVLTTRLL